MLFYDESTDTVSPRSWKFDVLGWHLYLKSLEYDLDGLRVPDPMPLLIVAKWGWGTVKRMLSNTCLSFFRV